MQQHLLQEGLSTFYHVTSVDGQLLDWDHKVVLDLAPTWQQSYNKIISNLQPIWVLMARSTTMMQVFFASIPLQEDNGVWQYEMTRQQRLQ